MFASLTFWTCGSLPAIVFKEFFREPINSTVFGQRQTFYHRGKSKFSKHSRFWRVDAKTQVILIQRRLQKNRSFVRRKKSFFDCSQSCLSFKRFVIELTSFFFSYCTQEVLLPKVLFIFLLPLLLCHTGFWKLEVLLWQKQLLLLFEKPQQGCFNFLFESRRKQTLI